MPALDDVGSTEDGRGFDVTSPNDSGGIPKSSADASDMGLRLGLVFLDVAGLCGIAEQCARQSKVV